MLKRTKIVATVGPASDSPEVLKSLILAGVNVFRLNFSHGTHEYHLGVLNSIRAAMDETGILVGVMQDISGPKIRVGKLAEEFVLNSGDLIDFYYESILGEKVANGHFKLSINEEGILRRLKIDDFIYLYDGLIRAKIVDVNDEYVRAEIENSGRLTSNKGVNFPTTPLGINILTEKDKRDMKWGVENGVDFMAISFVQNANDMINAREIVKSYGGNTQLIAKIEKFDAVENIDEILEHSDGLMVARGDLGIEVPYHQVPIIQKMLIQKANACSKPVITATQMLLSMSEKESATRAEISDVANAVLDGSDAVMLSEESAVGKHPPLAVQTMVKTIQAIEEIYPFDKFGFEYKDESDKINESVVRLGDMLGADGIISMTTSGQSVKKISRYRPRVTIYAATPNKNVARSLTLVWGVAPAYITRETHIESVLADIIQSGIRRNIINLDKKYIFTAAYPMADPRATNMIRILSNEELTFFGDLDS